LTEKLINAFKWLDQKVRSDNIPLQPPHQQIIKKDEVKGDEEEKIDDSKGEIYT